MPETASDVGRFTDVVYWDGYWQGHDLPVEVRRDPATQQVNAILDVFDAYLEADPGQSILEVGGGSGGYLAYMHRRFAYRCAALDFSPQGCELTRRNFELLGIPLEVHERDVLEPGLDVGPFDVVYSLGLVEHFDDLTAIVAAHARLVRPGGTLVIGAPNIVGVNRWFMARLGPDRLAVHNPACLEPARWDAFEAELGLQRRFRDYVGGFEPGVFTVLERRTPTVMALWALTRAFVVPLGRLRALRRVNAPWLSGYLMAVYRVPDA